MHFSNLLCHASTHSRKDFSGIARSFFVTAALIAFESWKRVLLKTSLSLGNKKEVTRGQIWKVGWLLWYSNVMFGTKFLNSEGIMSWSFVMMKQPWPRYPRFSFLPSHWVHQTSQEVFVDMLINSLALWQEFWVDNSMDIKKAISITLVLDSNTLAILGLGDNLLFHSRLRRLVIGSYSKILDSSPGATLFSKFGSVSSYSKMSWHTCTRRSFDPSFSNPGTIFAQIFLIPRSSIMIVHALSLFIPSSSAIILTARRWSLCTFCLTRSTFSSVLLVDGFPLLWSSSPSSLPSLNLLCHSKRRVLVIVSSP